MRSKPTITVAAITKRFDDIDAVRDVSFAANSGEVIGFVGPNGAGKTTTLSILMGFLRADKGSVRILDKKVVPETSHRIHDKIGFVGGDMVLPRSLTGEQYAGFTASRNGRVKKQYDRLVKNLAPVLDRPIGDLSRGNKQKIALLGALQHEPDILVLDEPTSGLDPLMQDVFLDAVRSESKRGVTVIMSSHILSEIASICSRILFMRSGRLILDKPMEAITGQLGKQISLSSPEAVKLAKFLPEYTSIISSEQQRVRFSTPKDKLPELLRWMTTKQVTDLTIEDRELDDVFHELYKGGGSN